MVWGLSQSSSFGKFSPSGVFVGLEERIKAHCEETMKGQTPRDIAIAANELRSKCVRKYTQDLGPLEEFGQPKELRTEKTQTELGSMLGVRNRLMVVDEAFKNAIEGLEPNVHQFWRMRITGPKGKEFPREFYGLIIRTHLDSFSLEDSDPASLQGGMGGMYFAFAPTKPYITKLALRADKFGSHHLWHEKHLLIPDLYMSDALQAEIKRLGLVLPKHFKMKEV